MRGPVNVRRLMHLCLTIFLMAPKVIEGFVPASNRRKSVSIPSSGLPERRSCGEVSVFASNTDSVAAVPGSLFKRKGGYQSLGKVSSTVTKIGMLSFIASMCVALPVTLFPPYLLHKLGFIEKVRQEQMSLRAGQFSARWLLRLIPFCKITPIPNHDDDPQPSIWVCNHTSALDVFMLLAADLKLRGKKKRPLKIVYWQQLEENPITKLLFRQCGFIPVQMAANKAGEDNDYDVASFKSLLKQAKKAFDEGFDIGILPEGQLNPNPEESLLPCFPGAFTLARMSRRPIQMMALHGTHRLWHAREDIGMTVTGRDVSIRVYPHGRKYQSGDEFLATFNAVVGKFATTGQDLPDDELQSWLQGKKWQEIQKDEQLSE